MRPRVAAAAEPNSTRLAGILVVAQHRRMEVAASRPTRLLPLRCVAALLLLAQAAWIVHAAVDRHELIARQPALTPKMLATSIALTFVGSVALAFLAFARQRFGLWVLLGCAAGEFVLELAAGFPALHVLRVPVAAALSAWAAHRAWPELRALT
jgi:hypothetical protein